MIGRLERLPLRDVWPHEAHDFTVWMEANVDALDDAVGLGLASAVRERSTGVFAVDLLCETDSGARVVVENQLERSDHDHLGKLVTYLAAFDAAAAVWVVADARPEHVQAVAWLNESTASAFYLVKVEAVRVVGAAPSVPAPVFTLLVGPSEEAREVGATKRELSGSQDRRHRFLEGLVARDPETPGAPPKNGWLPAGSAPVRGARFCYKANQSDVRLELVLEGDLDESRAVLARVLGAADAIGREVGVPVDASFREGQRRQKVTVEVEGGYGAAEDAWPGLLDALTDRMGRFRDALRPYLPG